MVHKVIPCHLLFLLPELVLDFLVEAVAQSFLVLLVQHFFYLLVLLAKLLDLLLDFFAVEQGWPLVWV